MADRPWAMTSPGPPWAMVGSPPKKFIGGIACWTGALEARKASWMGPAEEKVSWTGPTLGGALEALTLGGALEALEFKKPESISGPAGSGRVSG